MADDFVPLADRGDVENALGRALTSSEVKRAYDALVKASELFRKEAQRSFTPGRRTNRLRSHGGEIRLREAPIVAVTSVTDDDGNPLRYTWLGSLVTLEDRCTQFVRVTFSYGDDEVPELVRTTVAAMVAGVFDVDKRARAGMTQFQRTAGPFTEGGTFAAWAVGGQVNLSPADAAIARGFRLGKLGGTYSQGSAGR